MNCGINFIKYLLFIFNFLFTLCGLALLIIGVLIHLEVKQAAEILEENVSFPAIGLIVIGAIIFTIAFFGCCGAIRENHCMIVTFAVLLLTILVVQVAVAIYSFVKLKDIGDDAVREPYTKAYSKYWSDPDTQEIIDFVQSNLDCCGVDSYKEFQNSGNYTVPWSCCEHQKENDKAPCTRNFYPVGCVVKTTDLMKRVGILLGGVALGIAVVEFIGIIFALCLANSIRNAERRGYRV